MTTRGEPAVRSPPPRAQLEHGPRAVVAERRELERGEPAETGGAEGHVADDALTRLQARLAETRRDPERESGGVPATVRERCRGRQPHRLGRHVANPYPRRQEAPSRRGCATDQQVGGTHELPEDDSNARLRCRL